MFPLVLPADRDVVNVADDPGDSRQDVGHLPVENHRS